MKTPFLFIAFFLILNAGSAPKALAQFKVSGTVSSIYDNRTELQPGVNIQEKGTNLGTVTDINGKFSYTCTTEKPVLVFSLVGQLSKEIEINSDTVLYVFLEEAPYTECSIVRYKSQIGISSGLIYNPLGVKFKHLFPHASAEVNWRFLTKNNYLNLKIRSRALFDRRISFQARYRNLFFHKNNDRIEQFEFNALYANFSVGYAHNFRKIADENRQNSGLALGFYPWFGRLQLGIEGVLWSDKSVQYRIDLQTDMPSVRRVGVGISHEQIFGYSEWGVSMFYHFYGY